jgi:hypothetical protein
MKTSAPVLKSILDSNIAEIKFTRRRPKSGVPSTRRMLCTNSRPFLNSFAAKEVFGWRAPTQPPKYDAMSKGLVVAYDLFMQSYRAINASTAEIITIIPVVNEKTINEFWSYFKQNMATMGSRTKQRFMDR